ncbi:MAG TPA: hypothetical protein VKQ34_01255 [Candidatus Saccharimonadales bacterium]|nr:hypothetical protein [Candidatus Saccharimonadales bacterium]
MPERDFNLSNTPNTSALIVVRGEVQDNHVRNFGSVMRYGEVATISTAELEEAMPTIGAPLSYRGEYSELAAMVEHRRRCGSWVVEHVAKEFGLQPYKYDVHLLDGTEQPKGKERDMFTEHWRGVVSSIPDRPDAIVHREGPSMLWTYKPFELVDKTLERLGQEERAERPTLEQLVDDLQSARLPVRYRYADATLLTKRGDLEAARIEFGYPTQATFKRTTHPEYGTVNADGDRVLEVSEVSRRNYAPPVPVELQIALDDAKVAADRAVEEAIEKWGDEDMFMIADDGTTDYNNEARFAPIYNLL